LLSKYYVQRGMNPLQIESIGPSQSDYFKLIFKRFVAVFGEAVSVRDFEACD
jgi:hypothetical protein